MKVYFVRFPGIWFAGHAIVVAPNKEAAIFYTLNKHGTLSMGPDGTNLTREDFIADEVDFSKEGIFEYYSGDY